MFATVPQAHRSGRPSWRVLVLLAGVALALHAWLLQGVAGQASAGSARQVPAARVQVRSVVAAALPQGEPAATPPPPVAAVNPRVTERSAAQRAPVRARPRVDPPPGAALPAPPPEPVAAAAVAAPSAASAASASEPATAAATEAPAAAANPQSAQSSDSETPVYRTLFPPPLTLRYGLKRGMLSGSGELQWRPDGEHYELRLEGKVAGLNVLTQVSQGGFDSAGLAPLRFTDQRVRSAVRAANFQRERGEITFSGPSDVLTLLIGTQDRLSWMIQLAAVVSAEPQRLAAGGKVVMYVVGARADGDVWVFRSAGAESVETDAGPVAAVKFVREPRRPYDTQVEAWLDPARHHVPLRARLATAGSEGDALELLLHDVQHPP